jgi:hypothetical protein
MLSTQQLSAIADKINASVDLPFLGEEMEKSLISTALNSLGPIVAGILSKDQAAAISDPNKGIDLDAQGKANLQNDLMGQLMQKLPLGGLNEALGGGIGKIITDTLIGAMAKGSKL